MRAVLSRSEAEINRMEENKKPLERNSADLYQQLGAAEHLHKLFAELTSLREVVQQDQAEAPNIVLQKQHLDRCAEALQMQPYLQTRDAAKKARITRETEWKAASEAVVRTHTAMEAANDAARTIPDL